MSSGKSYLSPSSHSYNTRSSSGKSPSGNVCYAYDDPDYYDSSSDDDEWVEGQDNNNHLVRDDASSASEVTLELDALKFAQLRLFPTSPRSPPSRRNQEKEKKYRCSRSKGKAEKSPNIYYDQDGESIEDLMPRQETDDSEKDQLRAMLKSSIVQSKPNVNWDDIVGLGIAKSILKKTVILPVRFPSVFTGKRQPFKAILLYGPPGTGKTLCAKAVATEISDCTFYNVSSSDLMSKWAGESEKLVRNLFEMAQENESEKVVIFFDEIDSLVIDRDGDSDIATRKLLSELLICMDGVERLNNKILVLGATNRPWALDPAIRRRFEKRVYIPLPSRDDRSHIIKLHVGETNHKLSEDDFIELGTVTEGLSASDLDVLVRDVLLQPISRCEQASLFVPTQNGTHFKPVPKLWECPVNCVKKFSDDNTGHSKGNMSCSWCGCRRMSLWDIPKNKLCVDDISICDFHHVLRRRSCGTVSIDELRRYDEWTDRFGEKGST